VLLGNGGNSGEQQKEHDFEFHWRTSLGIIGLGGGIPKLKRSNEYFAGPMLLAPLRRFARLLV
jgi:hypothetical protein